MRLSIAIDARFGRRALAPSIATVVEDEEVDAQPLVKNANVRHSMANIARVAVQPEPGDPRWAGPKPAVQLDSVFRCEEHILEG